MGIQGVINPPALARVHSRQSFIEQVVKTAANSIEDRQPLVIIDLARDPITNEQILRVQAKTLFAASDKKFPAVVQGIADELNTIVNRFDRRYGLFWMQRDSESEVINIRFNATDNMHKIASNPNIECLFRSGLFAKYNPDLLHNADDIVKFSVLDLFDKNLSKELSQPYRCIYDSRSKIMTFEFVDSKTMNRFTQGGQFLALVNRYNQRSKQGSSSMGVLKATLLNSKDTQKLSYELEFVPDDANHKYQKYKARLLNDSRAVRRLIHQDPIALDGALLTQFV